MNFITITAALCVLAAFPFLWPVVFAGLLALWKP